MAAIRLPEGAWVVVCDGSKLLVLENTGDASLPDLRTREADKIVVPPTQALGTDQPGRVQESATHGRSAYEQTNWHDRAEQEFLTELAHRLDQAVKAKKVSRLVMVAPPRALGVLRRAYTPRLRDALLGEVDKDLTGLTVDQIQRRLTGIGLMR